VHCRLVNRRLLCPFEQPAISVGRVQVNFLHLLSSEAEQHIIIHCLNISVWRSAEDQLAAQSSVRFKAWSGEMFELGGELEPEVIEDSCWVGQTTCHGADRPFVDTILDIQTYSLVETFMLWTITCLVLLGFRWKMAAGTKPILCSTSWIPLCSPWLTSTTSPRLHLAPITTSKWVPYASCEGWRVSLLSVEGWILASRWHLHAGVEIGAISSKSMAT